MKNKLLNELEKEAPFNGALKLQVIRKANEGVKRRIIMFWLTSGAMIVVAALFCIILLPYGGTHEPVSVKESDNLVSEIISYSIGEISVTNDQEVLLSLQNLINNVDWDKHTKLDIRSPDYEINIQLMLQGNSEVENIYLGIWEEKFGQVLLYGDLGLGKVNGKEAKLLLSLFDNEESKVTKEIEVVKFMVIAERYEDSSEIVKELNTILNRVTWTPNIKYKRSRNSDLKLQLFVRDSTGNGLEKKNLNVWVNNNKIDLDGDYGAGHMSSKDVTAFLNIITLVTERSVVVRDLLDEKEQEVFSTLINTFAANDYDLINGENFNPRYTIRINGRLYHLNYSDLNGQLTVIPEHSINYAYKVNDQQDIIAWLRNMSQTELDGIMNEVEWQEGAVSMTRPYDISFSWNGVMYQFWHNGDGFGTLVPRDTTQLFSTLEPLVASHLRTLIRELE